jgi:long-chain acyl-CoA synthetase
MDSPKRLFDCVEHNLKKGGIDDMLAAKENGVWKKYSTQSVSQIVNDLSAGLLHQGIGPTDGTAEGRDKIAVIAKNRPEWLMLDLAVQQIGAILIPIYPTININELEYVLNDAAVKIIFVNDDDLHKKIVSIKHNLAYLKQIYSFEKIVGQNHWKEILDLSTPALLSEVKNISATIEYEDLATIIYTSGTTGKPKGVMLSHKNIVSNVLASIPCFPPGERMKALSFLPLNHIFERMVSYIYLFKGTAIYYAESLDMIGDNLREVKPDLFTTVPRLLEKVYDRIMAKGYELSGIKRKLFFWAHDLATRFEINKNQGYIYNMKLAVANKIIFNKWRDALGGKIKSIISGGAACQVRLIRIFTAAKIVIMEGYGLTETSPVISVNRYNERERMFGSVGPLLNNVEVKIANDGEILCKGPNVMMGYYKHPELTAEVMEDDWLKTGDIGIMVNSTFLKITDRKKEMFKTSGGKYVAPYPIENKFKESIYIENIMVIGAGQKFVGALIIPSFSNLKQWCSDHTISYTSDQNIIDDPGVIKMYKELMDEYNQNFNHVEQIKKFELLPRDWTVDTGEMTPKLSLKRKVIMEKHQDAIDRIYT